MDEFKPMKKVKSTEKVVITMRIDIEKLEFINKIAISYDMSRNELIMQCIDFALDNLKNNEN